MNYDPADYPYGVFCGNVDPHAPHGECFGIMADDGSNAEDF